MAVFLYMGLAWHPSIDALHMLSWLICYIRAPVQLPFALLPLLSPDRVMMLQKMLLANWMLPTDVCTHRLNTKQLFLPLALHSRFIVV